MHGVLTETRWPFTQSQWMELEHQALIYKYIAANVPIPSNLLIPIRKALDSAGFPSFSAGFFRPNTSKFCLLRKELSSFCFLSTRFASLPRIDSVYFDVQSSHTCLCACLGVRQCLYFVEEGVVCARWVFFSFSWSINPVVKWLIFERMATDHFRWNL